MKVYVDLLKETTEKKRDKPYRFPQVVDFPLGNNNHLHQIQVYVDRASDAKLD